MDVLLSLIPQLIGCLRERNGARWRLNARLASALIPDTVDDENYEN